MSEKLTMDRAKELLASTTTEDHLFQHALAVSACNLTDFGPWNGLIFNTLCLGLPTGAQDGRWAGVNRRRRREPSSWIPR